MPSVARLLVTSVVAAVLMLTPPAVAEAGRKYALLIGLDDYGQEKGITRLGYARKDVEEMQKALTALGFEFPERPLVNEMARRVDIVRALTDLADRVTGEDTFLLFFAGHGVRARNGHTYWLTRDSSLGLLDENGIRLEHLMDYVRDIKAKSALVLLDHCFSGDVTRASDRSRSLDSSSPTSAAAGEARAGEGGFVLTRGVTRVKDIGDEILAKGSGLLVLAAAREEAFEADQLKHGVFTSALLEALRSRSATAGDAGLSVLELSLFLGRRVRELSQSLRLPDQGVQPIFPTTGFTDWELGKPPSGDTEQYLRTLERWSDVRAWISVRTKMQCMRIVEKEASASTGGPALTEEESRKLQVIVGHIQYEEGQEESYARALERAMNPQP